MKRTNFFLAGCQKTGSTWLYRVFTEHPEIFVPNKDAIHYFDINYWRGDEWYSTWFDGVDSNNKLIVDPTPSYIRDPYAPKRIFDYNKEAKILFIVRNPIDRAFSHYWHLKSRGSINYSFEEAIQYSEVGNYDIFNDWIMTGFYYSQINKFLQYFDKNQIFVALYEDLKNQPDVFLQDILKFGEVDFHFKPSIIDSVVNKARDSVQPSKLYELPKPLKKIIPSSIKRVGYNIINKPRFKEEKTEYDLGIKAETKKLLLELFKEENDKLSKLIGKDLSFWNK